jgi:hypothetical protein
MTADHRIGMKLAQGQWKVESQKKKPTVQSLQLMAKGAPGRGACVSVNGYRKAFKASC